MERPTQTRSSLPVASPCSVTITDAELPESMAFINSIAEHEYITGSASGFDIGFVSDKQVAVTLITSQSIQVGSYDTVAGEMVTEEVTETSSIPFRVDFERGVVEVYTDKQGTRAVLDKLDAVVSEFASHETHLDLAAVAQAFETAEIGTTITALRISEFSLGDHTSGNCYLNVKDDETARNLLAEYSGDISYLGTQLTIQDDAPVTVGFYSSGSVRIFSNTDDEAAIVDVVKSNLVV